jgi:hypothetical protein
MGITVIGVDPGSEKSAYVLWDNKKILDKGHCPNKEMLWVLQAIDANEHPGCILAIETMVSIPAGAGKSIVDTIFWAGQFYQEWEGRKEKVPVHVVRTALGAKNDPSVRKVLIQRFGEPGTAKNPNPITFGLQGKGYHLWRAFAVAVVWMDHLEFQGSEMK